MFGPIGSLLGLNGGVMGTGIQGPSAAPITNPVPLSQINDAYTSTQNSLASQQALLAALQSQNGLQNQSNVYNQFQDIVAGRGPNPAQAMLNQATGQNVANQAALAAGVRGANANAGLVARQAAQAGAGAQQQAAGQAATMQANQSLNALNSAGAQANAMANNQVGQTNANTQAQQAEQQALLQGLSNFNSAAVGSQGSINTGNAALANTQLQGQQGMVGGILQGIGAGLHMFADGGAIAPSPDAFSGPQSKFGQFLNNVSQSADQSIQQAQPQNAQQQVQKGSAEATKGLMGLLGGGGGGGGAAMAGGMDAADLAGAATMLAAKGGEVQAMVSPGEVYLTPEQVAEVIRGADPMKVGEKIGGKPKVGGAVNSYSNDTVKKNLQVGGFVVPRSETQSKKPERNAGDFVRKVFAKQGRA